MKSLKCDYLNDLKGVVLIIIFYFIYLPTAKSIHKLIYYASHAKETRKNNSNNNKEKENNSGERPKGNYEAYTN